MRTLVLATLAITLLAPGVAHATGNVPADQADDTWQPNGAVNDVQPSLDGSKVYLGGQFDYVGPMTGSSVRLDPATGNQAGAWPTFSGGDVNVIVSDGSGGWFVGGSFTKVDGNDRAGLAHVTALGMPDAFWNAGAGFVGGTINAIAVDGSHVFVGGSFTSFNGGAVAPNLIALDRSSGGPTAGWSTLGMGVSTNSVSDLAVAGGALYVAGEFTNYPGATNSSGIVKVDAASGAADGAWPLNSNGAGGGSVSDIEIAGSTLYLGGSFTTLGGAARQRLAAIDLGTNAVATWAPVAATAGVVRAIAVTSSTVFVGATGQGAVVAVSRSTGSTTTFGPALTGSSSVTALAVRGGELLVGGDFIAPARRFVSINLTDGSIGPSSATFGSQPRAIAVDGPAIIVGGSFSSATGVARTNAAALSYATGQPTSWAPSVGGPVVALAEADARIYVASTAGPIFATFASTGAIDGTFAPPSVIGVDDIAVLPSGDLLVGGSFTSPGQHLVSYSPTGLLRTGPWSQPVNGEVKAIRVAGSSVYVGGLFSSVFGISRDKVARLDVTSGAVDATWIPPTVGGSYVGSIDTSGTNVYIGGLFTTVGGQTRQNVAALSAADGSLVVSWSSQPSTVVRALAVDGTDVILGGPFTTIAPPVTTRTLVAAVDTLTGAVDPAWNPTMPRPGTAAQAVAVSGTHVIVGTTAGVAIFDQPSLDTRPPAISIAHIDDAAGPADGVYVSGTTVFARSSNPIPPSFTVHAEAHDSVGSAADGYAGVSGLAKVGWPAVPASAGTWTPTAGAAPGKPRGLKLSCFNGIDPDTSPLGGSAIDRAIDYGSPKMPDQLPHLPASLATGGVGTPGATQNVDGISCRWTGYLLGYGDGVGVGTYVVQANSDDGFRADVGGVAIDDWAAPNATGPVNVTFAPDQARPITADWFDAAGPGMAQLLWGPPGAATLTTIPEGAFVTDVDYARQYTYTGGAPAVGTSVPLTITATDRRMLSSNASAQLTIDDTPPAASAISSTPPVGAWTSNPNVSLTITDGGDSDAGVLDRILERQLRALDPALHGCGGVTTGWQPVGGAVTGTTTRVIGDIPPLPAGGGCVEYRYTSRDQVGNTRVETYGPLRIDTAFPTGGAVSTAPGATNATTASIAVTMPTDAGSGIDPAATTLERHAGPYVNGTCGAPSSTTVIATNPGPTVTDPSLPDGTCVQYELVTSDLAGHTWTVVGPDVVQVDRTAPGGSLSTPVSPQSGSTSIGGSVTDGASGIATTTLTFSGPQSGTICTNPVPTSGFTCPWNVAALATGIYTVSLTSTDVAGNTSLATTATVQVDTDAPQLSPTVTGGGTAVYLAPATTPQLVWVLGTAAGSFSLATNATDASSGVASVSYAGGGAGWTPSSATSSTTGPWTRGYAWSAGAGSPGTMSFVATDVAGNQATALVDVESDAQPPSGGTISYPGGVSSVATLTLGAPADPAGSGVASTQVERASAPATTPTTCGTFGSWTAIGPVDPPSTWTDTSVAQATCYQYRLVATDHVGLQSTFTSAGSPFITATPGVLVAPASGTSVSEGGASLTYAVSLRAAPAVGNSVTVTPAGDGQAAPNTTPLTFTASNWNSPQTVSVAAVNDQHDEPSPMAAAVTFTVGGNDPAYVGMAPSIQALSVLDDDVASITFTPAGPLMLDEAKPAGAAYQVALTSQPFGTVTVSSTPGSPQVTASPSTLTFDSTNWSTPRTVTVVAVDDPDVEGTHSASVNLAVGATNANDAAFTALPTSSIGATIADNDTAGLEVASTPGALVDEAAPSTTTTVRVRLRARPATDVTVAATGVAGQLVATPAAVTFTSANWDQFQLVSVGAATDTIAEPSPSIAQLSLQANSTAPGFGSIPPTVVEIGVKDDDPAVFAVTPGAGWTTSDAGHLQLAETGEPTATVRIHAVGDPTADITITPVLTPAGQLDVTPRSITIPAGSHAHAVSFTVKAIDDHVAESDPQSGRIAWHVATTDPLYGAAAITPTSVDIADGVAAVTPREDTPAPVDPTPTPQPSQPAPVHTPEPGPPPSTTQPADPAPGTTVAEEHPANPTGGSDPHAGAKHSSTKSDSKHGGGGAVASINRTAARVGNWAKGHKVGASVAASVGGSAVVWAATAAKPLLLASKVLGGGGMPGPGHGMGQLRHLLKLRKKKREKWLRRLRRLRGEDDDLGDELEWDDQLDWWDDGQDAA